MSALAGARIARVEQPAAVGGEGGAAAGGAVLHVLDDVGQRLAGGDVVDVQVAALGAALGQRDGDALAVERRHVPVDGGVAARVERHRIEEHALGPERRRAAHHEERLLLGRLRLHGEELSAAPAQAAPHGRARLHERGDARADGRHARQRREERARPLVLRVRPGAHLGVLAVFEPAVVVARVDAGDAAGDRALGRRRSGRELAGSGGVLDEEQGGDGGGEGHIAHVALIPRARHRSQSGEKMHERPAATSRDRLTDCQTRLDKRG